MVLLVGTLRRFDGLFVSEKSARMRPLVKGAAGPEYRVRLGAQMTKNTNATAHVRQLCALGLGATAVVPALLRSIRRLVPCDSAAYFWADQNGDWVNLYAERMLPPDLIRRYFERYYGSSGLPFRQRMHECAALARPVVRQDAPAEGSEYYDEILKPLGAHRILHLHLQEGTRPLGQLSLYRDRRWAEFSPADGDALESVARYLAQGLNPTVAPPQSTGADDFRDSGEGALLVCTTAGDIISASYRAHALLAHASGEPINRSTLAGTVERKGRELLRRIAGSIGVNAPLHEATPSTSIENAWGRFHLNAYALGELECGVLIRRQEHLLVRIVDAMRALPLSAQQREVAVLLAGGLTNGQIARQLGVALNTSSYHVKQLYQKLGAHDRTHAIARILDGHTQRH